MAMQSRQGWRTSEFWLSLIAMVIGAVMASGALDSLASDHWAVKVLGLVASILGALGYQVSRTLVKGAEAKAAAIVKAAEAVSANPPPA